LYEGNGQTFEKNGDSTLARLPLLFFDGPLAEIDRLLKKVSEGVDIFDEIFEKIKETENGAQKEKLETDLKKEIKKLQRFRDQIKTWIASNDIKDKTALLDNRRLIEQKMEEFKACEKELKIKAFSKEGLNQATKIDPKEKEKSEMCQYIVDTIDKLNTQIDKLEAEVESLQLSSKKSRKNDPHKAETLANLNQRIDRHRHHIRTLEIINRMLLNGKLTVDQVKEIKDDVDYYVENNEEPEFEEDEGIYDVLDLEEAEVFGLVPDHEDKSEVNSVEDEETKRPSRASKDVSESSDVSVK
jgi:CCR4-NOT transcription complex subunit 3